MLGPGIIRLAVKMPRSTPSASTHWQWLQTVFVAFGVHTWQALYMDKKQIQQKKNNNETLKQIQKEIGIEHAAEIGELNNDRSPNRNYAWHACGEKRTGN